MTNQELQQLILDYNDFRNASVKLPKFNAQYPWMLNLLSKITSYGVLYLVHDISKDEIFIKLPSLSSKESFMKDVILGAKFWDDSFEEYDLRLPDANLNDKQVTVLLKSLHKLYLPYTQTLNNISNRLSILFAEIDIADNSVLDAIKNNFDGWIRDYIVGRLSVAKVDLDINQFIEILKDRFSKKLVEAFNSKRPLSSLAQLCLDIKDELLLEDKIFPDNLIDDVIETVLKVDFLRNFPDLKDLNSLIKLGRKFATVATLADEIKEATNQYLAKYIDFADMDQSIVAEIKSIISLFTAINKSGFAKPLRTVKILVPYALRVPAIRNNAYLIVAMGVAFNTSIIIQSIQAASELILDITIKIFRAVLSEISDLLLF